MECSKCGCPDSELLERREWLGDVWEDRVCQHCGNQFTAPSETAKSNLVQERDPDTTRNVIYLVTRCPKCGAKGPPVQRTLLPVRYHKCDCGHRFRSFEED